jgi:hypothetical protein
MSANRGEHPTDGAADVRPQVDLRQCRGPGVARDHRTGAGIQQHARRRFGLDGMHRDANRTRHAHRGQALDGHLHRAPAGEDVVQQHRRAP